jgi:hypothetical protein
VNFFKHHKAFLFEISSYYFEGIKMTNLEKLSFIRGLKMNDQIKQEMNEAAKEKREKFLAMIEAQLPPIVFKNWRGWRDVLPFAPGTVANDDCQIPSRGPKEFVYVGRVKGYPKAAMIDYLREKVRFTA